MLRRFLRLVRGDNTSLFHQQRKELASKYLAGNGLEIGAIHQPLQQPKKANVKYVDRMSVADLRNAVKNDFEMIFILRKHAIARAVAA